MKKIKSQEKGQALILIALGMVILIGFAALAIDGSMVFSDKRHAQNAADTSAIAAALARSKDSTANYAAVAQTRSTSNGYNNNNSTNFVTITGTATPSGGCPDTGLDITVKIDSIVKTTFARVLGWTQLVNHVSATARSCDVVPPKPLYSGSSVWATQTGQCTGASSTNVYTGGTTNVNLYGGGLGSDSNDPDCIDLGGGETQLLKNDDGTCATITTVASSASDLGGVVAGPCPSTAIITPPKASPGDLHITCSGNATISGDTMSPGKWPHPFPGGATKLLPGTYCVNGDFKMAGGDILTGTGVTIVMNTGTLDWRGNSEVHLTAPTSGTYKGLLIYFPPSNSTGDVSMEGTGDNTFSGTVLAQNSHCKYAGTSDVNKQPIQFICKTWEATGTAQLNILYDASLLYEPSTPANVSLIY